MANFSDLPIMSPTPPPPQYSTDESTLEQRPVGPSPSFSLQHHYDLIKSPGDPEVDSARPDDRDSALGSEVSSLSTSASSSNYGFSFENGRRYQNVNEKYHLPNDIQEMERLELQHKIWMELLGGRLYLAPLQEIHMTHALDVGCGTGNWTMEFAAHHPGVEVIGTDLSPIQPEYVPVNCTFYLDDATRAWAFHQRFDYVHTRMLTFGITDWDAFVDQAYAHLQPGGFLELQEWRVPFLSPDDSLRPAHALARWTGLLDTACARLGLDAHSSADHAERMRRCGFEGVVERRLGMPIGPWALSERQKRIGRMGRRNLLEGLDGMSGRLFRVSGVMNDEAEIDTFLGEVRQDILNSSIHTMMPLDVIVGQRPFDN